MAPRIVVPIRRIREMARVVWSMHGAKAPVVASCRLLTYAWHRLFRSSRTFEIGGRRYHYAIHLQNATFRCERAVEVPLAIEAVSRGRSTLEVGNVLSQYHPFPHDVVDKYEQSIGVLNVDIVDFSPGKQYDVIVSVSTLEHVGWDEKPRDPDKILSAYSRLRSLLAPSGIMLVTVPLGYNERLDKAIVAGEMRGMSWRFMKRQTWSNEWEETDMQDAMEGRGYGSRFPCANAIGIGTYNRTRE